MRIFLYSLLLLIGVWSCNSTNKAVAINPDEEALFKKKGSDTVHLGNEESEYDIIIIYPGFNFWLQSIARPRGFYTQSYLENRINTMVINWNQRVLQPFDIQPKPL